MVLDVFLEYCTYSFGGLINLLLIIFRLLRLKGVRLGVIKVDYEGFDSRSCDVCISVQVGKSVALIFY